MKKNTKIIVGAALIFVSVIALLLIATPNLVGTEVSLLEIKNNPMQYQDGYILTQGLLNEDSIEWNPDVIELKFTIEDESGNSLAVKHHGVRPDNFSDGVIVILEGNMIEDGVFYAEKLQTKCPSKYESEDPQNYDKDFHKQFLDSSNNKN